MKWADRELLVDWWIVRKDIEEGRVMIVRWIEQGERKMKVVRWA
jgi:hypothetical protein